jgi:anti-sigma regulatory factor (Ser/Thr protein kinase)
MPKRAFPAWPNSVPEARGFVSDLLAQAPPERCQTAALLVSELATNAVRHADVAEFVVEVRNLPGEGRVWVGVTDTGDGQPVMRLPSVTAEDGRGLRLIAALADRWGAHRRRSTHEKTVWFELALPTVAEQPAG